MKKEHLKYLSNDGVTQIHAIRWEPEGEIRAILQISHGMVEFIDRYHEFAAYLVEQGIMVVGNDHLGHGDSVQSASHYGFFAKENGNRTLLRDIHKLRMLTQKNNPGVPYFLMGHSMGSFLARQYLCLHGEGLAGAIIMGTGYQPRIATQAGMFLTKTLAAWKGWEYRSTFIDRLAMGSYHKKFAAEGEKAWLSRNAENVKQYMEEQYCSFIFTLNGYYNLFYSIYTLSHRDYLEKMPRKLPVFFVAGEEDPVGKFGKGVKKVCEEFRAIGMEDVSCKLYAGDRHEILNEVDRECVYEDIANWIEKNLPVTRRQM